MATKPEPARRHAVETMWRFVYRTSLNNDMFNADPHPGNFLFCDDGRVAFLDFGCVQKSPKGSAIAREIHKAAGRKDEAAFRKLTPMLLETRGGRFEELAVAYLREAFTPQFSSPFVIDRPYIAGLVKRFRDSGIEAAKSRGDDVVPMPEGVFFMNRLQFGFYSVVARLNVSVDYAAIEREFL
jgi:hypothetical protein